MWLVRKRTGAFVSCPIESWLNGKWKSTPRTDAMNPSNQYATACVTEPGLLSAIEQACSGLLSRLPKAPDLVIVFAANYSSDEMDDHLAKIAYRTQSPNVIGCSCQGGIIDGIEHETGPSLTLWAACFADANILASHLDYRTTADGGSFTGWNNRMPNDWSDCTMIVLGDPFSFPVDILLDRLNTDQPGVQVVGGMASGPYTPGANRLLFNDQVVDGGAATVVIQGGPTITPVVSQGCRPIGDPMVVTRSERNQIYSLGGVGAFEQLDRMFRELPTRDQRLAQQGLHLGRVINEYQEKFKYGDFLIRNVVGLDREQNSITIGDYIRMGQTVQFHLRDHESASAELNQLLSRAKDQIQAQSALLFTCNGRGANMFETEHHDATTVQTRMGDIPVAGFFAAGEIGPVGGENFLHGYTASTILFS